MNRICVSSGSNVTAGPHPRHLCHNFSTVLLLLPIIDGLNGIDGLEITLDIGRLIPDLDEWGSCAWPTGLPRREC